MFSIVGFEREKKKKWEGSLRKYDLKSSIFFSFYSRENEGNGMTSWKLGRKFVLIFNFNFSLLLLFFSSSLNQTTNIILFPFSFHFISLSILVLFLSSNFYHTKHSFRSKYSFQIHILWKSSIMVCWYSDFVNCGIWDPISNSVRVIENTTKFIVGQDSNL